MFCRNCGTGLPDGAAFCANCGTSQTDTPSGAVATASDPAAAPRDSGDQLLEMVKAELGKDYKIEKELGRGGMAVVYKGVETALERVVAIKVVPPESANAGQAAERFRREARLAASLDHPNIIPVYRVGQAGPLHYMAMKFVEGRAVDAIVEQQGALPIPVAIAILRYSASGLAFAHDKKIVHRDIKGANILVDKDGRVMVSDFGIARALEEVSLTASGMMIGTPYFMSPEQCGGQKVSPQSDQYSLGVMGFQLLTGEVPFLADSMVGVIQHHYMTPVPDILAVRPEVPKELLDIIYCSLNKDPLDRFGSTKDMAVALDNVPQTDAQREEAEKLLKTLSAGQPIPKVRTGTLPPLALTISGPGPRVQPRPITQPRRAAVQPATATKKKKKNRKPMYQGLAVLSVAMLGAGWLGVDQMSRAAEQRRNDSAKAAQERAVEQQAALAASRGTLLFAGLPENFSIDIQGRIYRVPVVPLDTGLYVANITAPLYTAISRQVTVRPNTTDTIAVSMVLASNTPVPGPTTSRPGPAQNVVRDSGEVRLTIQPLRVEAFLGGQRLGQGRIRARLPVGTHAIRLSAFGCTTKVIDVDVRKDDQQVRNETVSCQ